MVTAASTNATLADLVQWVEGGVPVLRATATALTRMAAEQEGVSANAVSTTILRDPLMTLRVLRFLQSHRTRSQTADITTIAHALMMLGLTRFFREFAELSVLPEPPSASATPVLRAYELMSQARLAAWIARDWAVQRHDIDPDEVMVAALVYDIDILLMTLYRGATELETDAHEHAQQRERLLQQLGVPGAIRELTERAQSHDPRLLNVRLACRLAMHCSKGWQQAAIDEDLADAHRLLRISVAELWERVRRALLQAAREWRTYGVRPAAAYLPMVFEPAGASAAHEAR